jgi:SMC interacting uncharacterized protein involved in chromosome segregation
MTKEKLQDAVDVLRQQNAKNLEKIRELETYLHATINARDFNKRKFERANRERGELAAAMKMLEQDRAALIAITGRAIVTSGTR